MSIQVIQHVVTIYWQPHTHTSRSAREEKVTKRRGRSTKYMVQNGDEYLYCKHLKLYRGRIHDLIHIRVGDSGRAEGENHQFEMGESTFTISN